MLEMRVVHKNWLYCKSMVIDNDLLMHGIILKRLLTLSTSERRVAKVKKNKIGNLTFWKIWSAQICSSLSYIMQQPNMQNDQFFDVMG